MPNLYQEVVKVMGIAEDDLLGQMAAARSKLLNAIFDAPNNGSDKSTEQIKTVIENNNEFEKTVTKFIDLPENYPQLSSNENFQRILDELAGVENRLAVARNDYFVAVRYLNKSLDTRNDKITANWRKINGIWKLTAERAEKIDR